MKLKERTKNLAIALAVALTPLPAQAQQSYNGIPIWVVDGDIQSPAMKALRTNSWQRDDATGYGVGLMYDRRYWRAGFSGAWENNKGWRSRMIYLDCSTGRGWFEGIGNDGTPREGAYSAVGDGRKVFWQERCRSAAVVFQ